MLYPELDLWTTAKPFMERWAREQSGYRYVRDQLKASAQPLLDATLTMPVVATALLKRWNQESNQAAFDRAHPAARKRSPGFYLGVGGVCVGALALALPQTMGLLAGSAAWALVGLGAGLLLRGR
jgi:ubiquinone biosynthesis protein